MASVRIGGARVDITGQSADLERAMRRASRAYEKQEKDLKRLRAQAKKTNRAYDSLASAARRVGPIAGAALGGFGLAQAVKTVATFEQSIADLSAITGAVGNDLRELEKASLDLAGSSTYTGGQVADAFKLVASAKPDLLESTKALTEVTAATLTLAEAAGIQLTEAAVAVGGTLNQFALASSEAGRVVNVLAAGSKFGAASISEIAMAMKEFGVDAAGAGISVEEATAAVEALAAVNIKGSQAGTALRNIINRLDTHIDRDLRPSVVGLTGAFENLNRKGLDGQAVLKLFGLENVTTGKYLIGNVDLIRKLTEQLTGTNIAYEQAAIRTNTLSGKADLLASAWERFLNVVSDSGPWQKALDYLSTLINKTSDAIEKSDELAARGPGRAPPGTIDVGDAMRAAHFQRMVENYERLSALGSKATAGQLKALDAIGEKIERIYAAAGKAPGLIAPTIPMGHVERETVAPAAVPDEPPFYSDPYGPLGLEKAYELELETLGLLEDQKARDILATEKQAAARRALTDAERKWAAQVEAARKRLLGGNAYGGGRGGDPREIENQARLQAWEEERVAHEEAVAARVKVEKAASDEVMRQANAVRDAQVKAARDAQRAWETMAMSIGDHFANAFGAFVGGSQSAGEAFRSFASGVIAEMLRIQAQAAASQLLSFLGGLFISAPFGHIPTGGSTIRGGTPTYGVPQGRQLGGPVGAGRAYTVNEATGRSEVFVPDRDGRIVPPHKAGGMGGGFSIGNFTVQGVNDPTAILAVLYREIPRITSAVEGNIMDKSRYNNALRSALQRAAGTR